MLTTRHHHPAAAAPAWYRRPTVRWLLTFAGFPLGAVVARALAGPVDTTLAALAGGLVNGAAIGLAQGWALRPAGPALHRWVLATAVGLMLGLGAGASIVGFEVTTPALVVQGAICGLAVGAAQAVVLRDVLGRLALAWPGALAVLWAAGWAITAAVGVDVDEQFTVFGSSGALVVTALTAVLPLTLARATRSAS